MPAKKRKPGKTGSSAAPKSTNEKADKKPLAKRKTILSGTDSFALTRSEYQLKIVLDAARMAVWEWDLISKAISWYGNVLEIFQLDEPSVLNSTDGYMSLVHPDDRDKIRQSHEQLLQTDKSFLLEYRVVLNDKETIWISSSGSVIRDKKNNPLKITGTIQDITERKRVEKEREDSKTRYDMISTSAGLVIYDYNIVTGDILWSGNSIEVLGYKPEELGNIDRWAELIHPDDREEAFRLLEKAQLNLDPYDVYYRFSVKSGGYVHLHDRGFFMPDKDGRAIRMMGMMNDVTDRIESQESLKQSEQRFRTLQQASFGGIGLHEQGKIIDCNQGLCDLTGYSYDELIGSNGLELISPEFRDFVKDKILSGYDKTYDVEGIRKDGSRYVLEIRGKNIPLGNRTIRVTEFRDITDRKRVEEKIQEQTTRLVAVTEDLKRKNNQLEEFTQIVSHNLRSPVGNILTLLSFYDGAESEGEKAEYIGLLKEAATTTLIMLNELNDILKIKQSKNIEKQELHFEKVLEQIKSMMTAKITELGAEIVSDFSQAPIIQYPAIYLESIILNLLDNALKYHSPDRHPKVELYTTVNAHGNIILEVRDNGVGINLQRYGHQVFKLRKTFHHHPESRGIGLFMIKNQVESLGGEITISSKENQGTSFFINFNKHLTDAV
jgi:PAS domain S-box-containing protein